MRPFISHVVAGLLGAGAGALYAKQQAPTTRASIDSFQRRPLLDAATVAFRFGSREHARTALEKLLRMPPTNELEWADVMLAEVRLAMLDREFAPGSKQSRHIDAALAACRRLKRPDCSPEQLRKLVVRLVHQ